VNWLVHHNLTAALPRAEQVEEAAQDHGEHQPQRAPRPRRGALVRHGTPPCRSMRSTYRYQMQQEREVDFIYIRDVICNGMARETNLELDQNDSIDKTLTVFLHPIAGEVEGYGCCCSRNADTNDENEDLGPNKQGFA
jgi:hypothetical protein